MVDLFIYHFITFWSVIHFLFYENLETGKLFLSEIAIGRCNFQSRKCMAIHHNRIKKTKQHKLSQVVVQKVVQVSDSSGFFLADC